MNGGMKPSKFAPCAALNAIHIKRGLNNCSEHKHNRIWLKTGADLPMKVVNMCGTHVMST